MKKKLFGLMVLLVLCMMSAAQADCAHSFNNEDCTKERYCFNCEEWITTNTEHSWGAWDYGTGPHHARYCTNYDCIVVDFDYHTGGTATCTEKAMCTVCGGSYGNISPNNHDWDEWEYNGDDRHMRHCKRDPRNHFEDVAHSGGAPTCTTKVKCTVCGGHYLDIFNHADYGVTEWRYLSERSHYRLCLGCNTNESVAVHNYGDATCATPATCAECKATKGDKDKNNHVGGTEIRNQVDAGEFTDGYTGDTYCLGCDEKLADGQPIPATHVHSYSTATCTAPATCSCNTTQGDVDKSNHVGGTEIRGYIAPGEFSTGYTGDTYCLGCDDKLSSGQSIPATHVHSYSTATCTTPATCSCNATSGEALGHIPGAEADCTTDQVCTREGCGVVLNEKLGHAPGAEADCTTAQVCTREGCGVVLNEKLGHDYAAVVTKSTCTKRGYTTYTCSRCKDSYKADQTAARGHWYDLWNPNQDGAHSAECKRYGCDYAGTTDCMLFEITVKDGETETILTVCPVCGDHEETPFEVILEAVIKAVDRYALPRGEQIVRGMDAPFDGVLYAFTAAYEYSGKVEAFDGIVSGTLPLDAEKYTGFRLVRVDATPATETAERMEVWTDVAFTYEDGRLTFETDAAGLFMLLPVE